MSDIKLFRVAAGVEELPGTSVAVEKELQTLIEKHLETFLGVRFLVTEYQTGKTHGGRIDTLGIDENNSPVIIEYKRSTNENVINQGLYYFDWLLDHQGEFTLLAQKQLGPEVADAIDWSAPRLVCIAGDFTKFDEHAVQQINRSIELLRYRSYEGYLILELVNSTTGAVEPGRTKGGKPGKGKPQLARTVSEQYEKASPSLKGLSSTRSTCTSLLSATMSRGRHSSTTSRTGASRTSTASNCIVKAVRLASSRYSEDRPLRYGRPRGPD